MSKLSEINDHRKELFYLQEPAWVKANRAKYATQAQDMCSKKLLRTISGEVAYGESKKL